MNTRKLARFLVFAAMFASIVGLVISTLQALITQQPPSHAAVVIMAYGLGVISMGTFLTTGDAQKRVGRG